MTGIVDKTVNWLRSTFVEPGGNAVRQRKNSTVDLGTDNNLKFGSINRGNPEEGQFIEPEKDWRVRITLPPASKFAFRLGDSTVGGFGILSDLVAVDGVVFPYTPTVTFTHNARYTEQALTHSNYKNYFYEGSDVSAITITGVFTCQNADEALYVMGCVQFLRACTKMFFGENNTTSPAGTPPTLVRLSGYGDYYLPDITCVVTQVQHIMPDDADYIKFTYGAQMYNTGRKTGWMPTTSQLTVTLQPVVSRSRQARGINLDEYARGGYFRGTGAGKDQGGVI